MLRNPSASEAGLTSRGSLSALVWFSPLGEFLLQVDCKTKLEKIVDTITVGFLQESGVWAHGI